MNTKPSGSGEGTVLQWPLYRQVLLYGRLALTVLMALNVRNVGLLVLHDTIRTGRETINVRICFIVIIMMI